MGQRGLCLSEFGGDIINVVECDAFHTEDVARKVEIVGLVVQVDEFLIISPRSQLGENPRKCAWHGGTGGIITRMRHYEQARRLRTEDTNRVQN